MNQAARSAAEVLDHGVVAFPCAREQPGSAEVLRRRVLVCFLEPRVDKQPPTHVPLRGVPERACACAAGDLMEPPPTQPAPAGWWKA